MAARFCKEGGLRADMCCLHNELPKKPACRAFVPSIKKSRAFKAVYSGGRQAVNPYFAVYVMENNTSTNRLGVTVSKKVGKAVVRNRVKRLVKEICRLKAHRLHVGFDIVVVSRPLAGTLPREGSFKKLDKVLESLFMRLQLIKADSHG